MIHSPPTNNAIIIGLISETDVIAMIGYAEGTDQDQKWAGNHLRICYPRPGRGSDYVRPDHRYEPGADPADRYTGGHL